MYLHMITTIIRREATLIAIGNSRGIRIPKLLLDESGLEHDVELQVKKGEIKIVSAPKKERAVDEALFLSEKVLSTDWNKPEEDEAWAGLQ